MSDAITQVLFRGDEIQAIHKDGKVWVVVKRVCEALGITEMAQAVKLKEKPWAVTAMIAATGPDGRNYEMFCIDLDCLPMWLGTINAGRTRDYVREKLAIYQRECAHVLREHFFGKRDQTPTVSLPPPPQPLQSETEAKARICLLVRDQLLMTIPSMRPEMAVIVTLKAMVAENVISARASAEFRSAISMPWNSTPLLTPTQIGERLGGLKPTVVNKMLEAAGLQQKINERWEPTEKGLEYAGASPYQAQHSDHTGVQLKWEPRIVGILQTYQEQQQAPGAEDKQKLLF